MIAQVTYRPSRSLMTMMREAIAVFRQWLQSFTPPPAESDPGIDWEDGESR